MAWLDAHHDPLANVSAFSQNMALVDMEGNGECSLVIASLDRKLKVYKALALVGTTDLPGVPSSVVGWMSDDSGVPTIAVAAGRCVFMYRSLRPFYKFTPPPAEIEAAEAAVWTTLRKRKPSSGAGGRPSTNGVGATTAAAAGGAGVGTGDSASKDDAASAGPTAVEEEAEVFAKLSECRSSGSPLSSRSIDYLALSGSAARIAFIAAHRSKKLAQHAVVTCLAVLEKGPGSELGCLVVGTESRQLHILDPAGTTVLATIACVRVRAVRSLRSMPCRAPSTRFRSQHPHDALGTRAAPPSLTLPPSLPAQAGGRTEHDLSERLVRC